MKGTFRHPVYGILEYFRIKVGELNIQERLYFPLTKKCHNIINCPEYYL